MMKKSVQEAINEAMNISKQYLEQLIRVMDKKNKRAIITASEWIYKERVLYGYNTVITLKNGLVV